VGERVKCVHCGKSPHHHGITLLRQNPKGEEGVWACETCNRQEVPEDLAMIVAGLQLLDKEKQVH